MKIETIEIAGLASALTALRLPFGKEVRSVTDGFYVYDKSGINEFPTSGGLYSRSHGIDQLEWFKSYDTCQPTWYGCSVVQLEDKDLTLMQTLVKRGDEHAKVVRGIMVWARIKAPIYFARELETYRAGRERLSSSSTMHQECRGLSGEELQRAKAELPMGTEQDFVDVYSYQCLRNIVRQRHNHRLPEWHTFVDWVKTLPLAEELILVGLNLED